MKAPMMLSPTPPQRRTDVTAAVALLLTVLCLAPVHADTFTVTVDAKANLFGAGHTTPPAPGGGAAGLLPPHVSLPPGTNRVLTFSTVTGTVHFSTGLANDPDGNGSTTGLYYLPYGGISGLTNLNQFGYLAGIFLSDAEPQDPAPPALDFTDGRGLGRSFTWLAPALNQTFFIGDGLTGTNSGVTQEFIVPEGATRFFLGFVDSLAPGGLPGYYGDNFGAVSATFQVAATGGYALFSRVTDTISVAGNTLLTNRMTIEAEVLIPSFLASPTPSDGRIFTEQSNAAEEKELAASHSGLFGSAWTGNGDPGLGAANNLTLDTWHHIAFVRDLDEQYLYVDGARIATRTLTGTPYDNPIANAPSSAMAIGAILYSFPGVQSSFIGLIQWVRVSSTARYSSTFITVPPTVPQPDGDTQVLFDFSHVAPGTTTLYDLSSNRFLATVATGFTNATAPMFVLITSSPSITAQPKSQSTRVGQSATVSVTVNGSAPLEFQWYAGLTGDRNSPITGATNLAFTTPPLFSAVNFWVEVKNPFGSISSDTASVTLIPDNAASLTIQITAGIPFLSIEGIPGTGYRIDYTTDLRTTNWARLLNLTLPSSPFTFSDSGVTNSFRFYRAVVP
ncbi:MAG: LamG-like jellyroll fold domain-containing protein [Limisphaerales bacterium]